MRFNISCPLPPPPLFSGFPFPFSVYHSLVLQACTQVLWRTHLNQRLLWLPAKSASVKAGNLLRSQQCADSVDKMAHISGWSSCAVVIHDTHYLWHSWSRLMRLNGSTRTTGMFSFWIHKSKTMLVLILVAFVFYCYQCPWGIYIFLYPSHICHFIPALATALTPSLGNVSH